VPKKSEVIKKKKSTNDSGFFFIGDGLIENLFHFLWIKDPSFGCMHGIRVPDTIVFHLNDPVSWYFTCAGQIKKKLKTRLNTDEIKANFLKKTTKCGVVATFIHKNQIPNSEEFQYEFEYFDKENFIKFIDDHKTRKHGMLQRFVQPHGDYNFVIRAEWSPHFCFFEKKVSKHPVNSTKYDIYERCATFDGKPYMSKSFPVNGSIIKNVIEKWINDIITHVKSTSSDLFNLNRIIINFTIDAQSRLNLLYCSSIRCDNVDLPEKARGKSTVDTIKYKMPPKVDANLSISTLKPKSLTRSYLCTSCFKNQ
jgi:hypothetical protein